MNIFTHPEAINEHLIIEATNEHESDFLINFARLKDPLTATIEHDPDYTYPYIIIKKEKS